MVNDTDVELSTYRASDRRCYNGAYCSDLEKEFNHTDNLTKRMERAHPDARCTYFPAEGKFMVFIKYRELTGEFHVSRQEALIDAITRLEATEAES